MKRLTLRIKIWQAGLLALFVCLLAIPLFFPSLGYLAAGKIVSLWNRDLADAYYAQSVQSGGAGSLDSWQTRAENALQSCGGYLDSYLVSGGGVSGGGTAYLSPDDLEELGRQLDRLAGHELQGDKEAKAGLTMASLWFLHGELEKAQALMENLPQPKDRALGAMVRLHQGAMAICRGEYDEGAAFLEGQGLGKYETLAQWLAYCGRQMKAFQEGERVEQPSLVRQPDADTHSAGSGLWPLAQPLLGASNLSASFFQLEELSRPLPGGNTLTGQVDTDLEGAWLVISATRESSVHAYSSNDFAPYYAVTAVPVGKDGRFTLAGLPDGRYHLSVGTLSCYAASRSLALESSRLYDLSGGQKEDVGTICFRPLDGRASITFDGKSGTVEAQGLPEAHHYRIRLGGRVVLNNGILTAPLWESGDLSQPSCTWSLDGKGQMAGYAQQQGEPSPQEYLPAFYGTKTVEATVQGFDQEGNLLWATNQVGGWGRLAKSRFSQEITFTQPTQADQLLLEGRYEEAIPLYEETARQGDGYGAVILANLYQSGWQWTPVYDQDGNQLYDHERGGKDLEKAAYWWAQAADMFPQDSSIPEALGQCLWQLGDRQGALEQFLGAEPSYGYPTRWIGLLYWQMGEPEKAIEAWRQAEETGGNCREDLFLAQVLLGQQEGLADLARSLGDDYYQAAFEQAAAAYEQEDLSPCRDFFDRMAAGQPEEAYSLLREDRSPLSLLLQGFWLILWEADSSGDAIPQLEPLCGALQESGSPYAGVLERYDYYFR